MKRSALALGSFVALSLFAARARAGGGPMNVVVLYNGDIPEATTVAQHYQKARSLPKGHLCAVTGLKATDTTIDVPTFKTKVQAPLDACIAALPHPELVDYVVLVRGLPYAVTLPAYGASLQALVQVRHAIKSVDSSEIAGMGQPGPSNATVANPFHITTLLNYTADYTIDNPSKVWYGDADALVRANPPEAFHSSNAKKGGAYDLTNNILNFDPTAYDWSKNNIVIVSALDGFDYTDATALVDRAVASDGTFPKAELMCMQGEDTARAARDPECEFTTRMLTQAGFNGQWVSPFNGALAGHTVAAYFTGSADTVKNAIAGNTFVPGAITDNLTSFGAAIGNFACSTDGKTCPLSEVQTSCARFVRAGATGAHGTVLEPLNNVFPNAGTMLLYTFGYSMGESYFFNQRFLYWQNIYLGDPLATPYATRPVVTFDGSLTAHAHNTPIVVHAQHPSGVASIDLFKGGKRIAQVMGDTLSYTPVENVGDALDLLAVAVANDVPVTRTGWKNPNQKPRAEVQGWNASTVTLSQDVIVSEPTDLPDGGADSGSSATSTTTETGGCSCDETPRGKGTSAWLGALPLLALGLLRRRDVIARRRGDHVRRQ